MQYGRMVLFALAILGLICSIFWLVNRLAFKGKLVEGETKMYQILVTVHDEKNSNPIEDKKSSMKKGYVVGVYDENHEWSETEKVSYLILKIKLTEEEVTKIVQPIQRDIDIKTLPEEQQKIIEEEKNSDMQKEIISVREHKIDLDKLGFSDPNSLLNGQPHADRIFDWEIVIRAD